MLRIATLLALAIMPQIFTETC